MASSAPILVSFLLVGSLLILASDASNSTTTTTFSPAAEELRKYRRVRALLRKINKPAVKTVQSPDGDTIDCVPSHQQPAFDHPRLRGHKPLMPGDTYRTLCTLRCTSFPTRFDSEIVRLAREDPPEKPRGLNLTVGEVEVGDDELQWWSLAGDTCPEGTVPIRRTSEEDILRASSVWRYGRKPAHSVRRDSTGSGHEHAVGYASGDQYYGAKASLNVWTPRVATPAEFSLSQIWVISGSFNGDLNTIEAGWQVSPQLYGDGLPRFFTYWTSDAYRGTGCYNLLCSGFVQTNNRIALGAAISPRSTYNGGQFDITLLIWKDPKRGHWWLQFGSGLLVGYWPSFLFSRLAAGHAGMVQFGGEVVNTRPRGTHTSTGMGSGRFAYEGFRRAAYVRNAQVVDWDNNLVPVSNLRLMADHSNCYSIQGGSGGAWGSYFYYGGPGKSVRCYN